MISDNEKNNSGRIKASYITVIGGLICACIGGFFLIINSIVNFYLPQLDDNKHESNEISQPQRILATSVNQSNNSLHPTNTPISCTSIEPLQSRVKVGQNRKDFTVTVGNNEIIVGQGWQFWYEDKPVDKCYAFIINKPGIYSFSLYDGAWSHFRVCSESQSQSLLQSEIDSLTLYCKPVLTIEIP